jgi:hypothetical protein
MRNVGALRGEGGANGTKSLWENLLATFWKSQAKRGEVNIDNFKYEVRVYIEFFWLGIGISDGKHNKEILIFHKVGRVFI